MFFGLMTLCLKISWQNHSGQSSFYIADIVSRVFLTGR
jgi:hypothetical protein